jgi:hypothetical protein
MVKECRVGLEAKNRKLLMCAQIHKALTFQEVERIKQSYERGTLGSEAGVREVVKQFT